MDAQWVDKTLAEMRGMVASGTPDSVLADHLFVKINDSSLSEQRTLADDCDHLADLLAVEIDQMRRAAEKMPAGSEIIARRVRCLEAAQIVATSTAWSLRP